VREKERREREREKRREREREREKKKRVHVSLLGGPLQKRNPILSVACIEIFDKVNF